MEARFLGDALRLPAARVVSLVPSVTETLFDLGAGESVVGITDFCLFPEGSIESIARVGGTKNPDVELIRDLRPDLVYMNREENLERHGDAISRFSTVHLSEPRTVADVRSLIAEIGSIHQRTDEAETWIARLDAARDEAAARGIFTFACPIWKKPWMWCGDDTYVSHLIGAAGGRNVLAGRQRYPKAGIEEIIGKRPDVIFLPDEPWLFTEADADDLRRAGVSRIVGPFPGHLFTWHGTRTVEGLRFLTEALSS